MGAASVDERLVEPKSAAVAFIGEVSRIECVEGFGRNILATVVASRIKHHLIEAHQVVACREKSCVTSHTAHCCRVGVVDVALQLLFAERLVVFGWSNTADVNTVLNGLETDVFQSHRRIEMLADEDVNTLPTDVLHQVGQEYEPQVAVEVAGFLFQLAVGNLFEQVFAITVFDISLCSDSGVSCRGTVGEDDVVVFESTFPVGVESFEAGTMRKSLPDGDVFLVGVFKIGQIARQAVVEFDLAVVDELHHGQIGCRHLGERSQVEDGVSVDERR